MRVTHDLIRPKNISARWHGSNINDCIIFRHSLIFSPVDMSFQMDDGTGLEPDEAGQMLSPETKNIKTTNQPHPISTKPKTQILA